MPVLRCVAPLSIYELWSRNLDEPLTGLENWPQCSFVEAFDGDESVGNNRRGIPTIENVHTLPARHHNGMKTIKM